MNTRPSTLAIVQSFPQVDCVASKVDAAVNKNRGMSEAKVIALEKEVRRSLMNPKSVPETYNRETI